MVSEEGSIRTSLHCESFQPVLFDLQKHPLTSTDQNYSFEDINFTSKKVAMLLATAFFLLFL